MRTGYSFRDAVGSIKECIARLKAIGAVYAPIADLLSTYGYVNWEKEALAAELKPVFGVSISVTEALGQKRPATDEWSFYAKGNLRPLHDLIGLATDHAHNGLLTYKEACGAKDVIKVAGMRTLLGCVPDKAPDLYIGLSPGTPKALFKEATRRKFNLFATSCNKYPAEEDFEFYRIALGSFNSNSQTYPQWELSDKEWAASVAHIADAGQAKKALGNRNKALSSCTAALGKATMLQPLKPKTLLDMCKAGAKLKGINLKDPIYKARLERELKMIYEKKFEDYFYVLEDVMRFAKLNMLVGPGRGSSSGSLVCYLLSITEIDSIRFELLFERFLSPDRFDMPDIDIDFSDTRRHLVFEYMDKKYGEDHVARLGTVSVFRPRSALKQVAIGLRIPQFMVEKVLDGLIERSGGDSRALDTMLDTFDTTEAGQKMLKEYPEAKIAARMEGHPSHSGQHAAGVMVTQDPIANYVATDNRTGVSMCDKKASERLNLLKIDALGLAQLGIFEGTLRRIGIAGKEYNQFMRAIPIDDPAAIDVLNKGNFAGIFQWEGKTLQILTKMVKVESFNDMVMITALARPGPIATGGTNAWARRRMGREKVSYAHPLLKPYLEATLGIVTYQEQVMVISKEIGDLDYKDISLIRKAMSASLGIEHFNKIAGDKFWVAAVKKGIPEKVAKDFWNDLCKQGSWSFNMAHAVSYGMVSYHCCYLKAHHSVEFAAATLDSQTNPQKQIQLLRELKVEGINYVSVDPEKSTHEWTAAKNRKLGHYLIGPLTSIKGIGPASVATILEARKNGGALPAGLIRKLEEAKTEIDTLTPIGDAIKRLHPELSKINIISKPTPIKQVQSGVPGDVVVLALAKTISPRDMNDAQNVAKRGHKVSGPHMKLNLIMLDDTDECLAIIDRYRFVELAIPIIERGRAGKALYAVKGDIPRDFRMISVRAVKFLGFTDGERNG